MRNWLSAGRRWAAEAVLGAIAAAALVPIQARAQTEGATQDWDVKYQATYNWQKHPSFNAAYTGQNSLLRPAEKMYTFSATAHLGARVWRGGEVYLNIEAVQGVPFSGALVGLGSFTNGEITRAAGTSLSYYRQRLFLRQTWNRGGGDERQDSDFNQLAGAVSRNRVVLTAGNFSTLDVFDDNSYAKDPRTQFMNWGNWTYSSWDYAADARGFGWGAALEWYANDWVVRFARMTGPKEPNGLAVDFNLGKHYGDQLEIERAHRLAGRPGKLRLLAWRNRAVLAGFRDATRYREANPGADPQTIFNVREGEKIKYGVGLNLEQELSANVGLFFRGMKTDGRTETYAFTEVDDSLSGGVLVRGAAWQRPDDAIGVALLQNFLSRDRRRYLAAGGVSFFIGDGNLSYRPETILETFYSLQVYRRSWITFDYQHIRNPAYNADRGPVNVFAVRFHAQF